MYTCIHVYIATAECDCNVRRMYIVWWTYNETTKEAENSEQHSRFQAGFLSAQEQISVK